MEARAGTEEEEQSGTEKQSMTIMSVTARLKIFAAVSATAAYLFGYCALIMLLLPAAFGPLYIGGYLVSVRSMVLYGLISAVLGAGLQILAASLWRRATGDSLAKGIGFAFLWSLGMIVLSSAVAVVIKAFIHAYAK